MVGRCSASHEAADLVYLKPVCIVAVFGSPVRLAEQRQSDIWSSLCQLAISSLVKRLSHGGVTLGGLAGGGHGFVGSLLHTR